jgi:hypothetical protein
MEAFDDDEEDMVPTPLINIKIFTARMEQHTALENEREANGKFMLSLQGREQEPVSTPGVGLGLAAFLASNATDKAWNHLDALLREAVPVGWDFQKQCREKVKLEATNLLTGLGDKCADR